MLEKLKEVKKKLKITKATTSKRNLVHKDKLIPSEIDQLKHCNTKTSFKTYLLSLTDEWKEIFKFYLTDCFIYDLYSRKIDNKRHILSKREIIYSFIDNPKLLELDCNFDNNFVKNFCTGLANFLQIHLTSIKTALLDTKILKKVYNRTEQ